MQKDWIFIMLYWREVKMGYYQGLLLKKLQIYFWCQSAQYNGFGNKQKKLQMVKSLVYPTKKQHIVVVRKSLLIWIKLWLLHFTRERHFDHFQWLWVLLLQHCIGVSKKVRFDAILMQLNQVKAMRIRRKGWSFVCPC